MRKLFFMFLIGILYDCSNTLERIQEDEIVYGIEAIDGQTFRAYNSDKSKIYQVSIHGIAAPAFGEQFYSAAVVNLTSLVADQEFVLKNKSNKNGSNLTAEVYFPNQEQELAEKILINGFAKASDKNPDKNYVNAQVLGMQTRKGIWSDPNSFD